MTVGVIAGLVLLARTSLPSRTVTPRFVAGMKTTVRIPRTVREAPPRHARGIHRQRIAGRVLVDRQDPGRLDLQERPLRAVADVVHRDAGSRLDGRGPEGHQGARRTRSCSISAI